MGAVIEYTPQKVKDKVWEEVSIALPEIAALFEPIETNAARLIS
jgi:hypothetical protein